MAGGLGKENRAVLDRPHFFIGCGEIQPPDAGEGNGGGAHGAGFKRHVDIAIDQAFGAQFGGHLPDDKHLGMGGGVMVNERPVSGNRQNITQFVGDHRAHGNFAPFGCLFGFGEGLQHGLWQFLCHRAT